MNAHLLLLIIAALCFFAAAVTGFANRPYGPHIGWLGLFFATLAFLVR